MPVRTTSFTLRVTSVSSHTVPSQPAPHCVWRDGTTHIVFTPHELIEKLIPLIPRPRCHLVRYHGILGPAAKDRAKVVPTPPAPLAPDGAGDEAAGADKVDEGEAREIDLSKIPRASRLAVGHSSQTRVSDRRSDMPEVPRADEDPGRNHKARSNTQDSRPPWNPQRSPTPHIRASTASPCYS